MIPSSSIQFAPILKFLLDCCQEMWDELSRRLLEERAEVQVYDRSAATCMSVAALCQIWCNSLMAVFVGYITNLVESYCSHLLIFFLRCSKSNFLFPTSSIFHPFWPSRSQLLLLICCNWSVHHLLSSAQNSLKSLQNLYHEVPQNIIIFLNAKT